MSDVDNIKMKIYSFIQNKKIIYFQCGIKSCHNYYAESIWNTVTCRERQLSEIRAMIKTSIPIILRGAAKFKICTTSHWECHAEIYTSWLILDKFNKSSRTSDNKYIIMVCGTPANNKENAKALYYWILVGDQWSHRVSNWESVPISQQKEGWSWCSRFI